MSVEQISFRQCLTVCEHGQLKGWQPCLQPTEAKSSISTSVQCFGGSCCMETWGRLLQDSTTNGRGDHKPKNLIETSLWEAWLWVAWIEEGQQILGTENLRWKIIRIHHLFTTQTSTLTMFELDCDSRLNNSPLPTLWYFHEWNVFAIALLLNKPCLWGLCVQSSTIKRTAHIHLVHLFGTLLDVLTW